MLVIISDLHLTDGTSCKTIGENAFKLFTKRVREMALAASYRQDGTYKPIKRVDILLLGDILDVIRSRAWLEGDPAVRPWSESSDPAFIEKVNQISNKILETNESSLGHLKKLSKELTLPPDDTDKKHADKKCEYPVKVKIHYMVGNHDWFYHLPGDAYNSLRKSVVNAMGLANCSTKGFPHDPEECPELARVLSEHEVFARHGDIHDPFNFDGDRDTSSLGDCVVVELLNNFPLRVQEKMGEEFLSDCLDGLRELDNVRPLIAIPIWIDTLLKKNNVGRRDVKRVERIWDVLVDNFLNLDFVRCRDSFWNPWDSVDKLQIGLKFSKGIALSTAGDLAAWWNERRGIGDKSYYTHAVKEKAFKNRSARYLVYGHTHSHEIVPLDVSFQGEQRFDQIYFNAGTWRRVHRLAQADPDDREFIAYDVMTYLCFFKGDERKGRPFACWSGALSEPRTVEPQGQVD